MSPFINPYKVELSQPYKVVRVLDYVMPVDSTFLNYKGNKSNSAISVPILGGHDSFKRVERIEYDVNKSCTVISLEEKFPKDIYTEGSDLIYMCEFLKSLGDKDAFELGVNLKKHHKKIQELVKDAYFVNDWGLIQK